MLVLMAAADDISYISSFDFRGKSNNKIMCQHFLEWQSLLGLVQQLDVILYRKNPFQMSMDVERIVQWVHSACYANFLCKLCHIRFSLYPLSHLRTSRPSPRRLAATLPRAVE